MFNSSVHICRFYCNTLLITLEIDNVMRWISAFWCPTLRKLLFCFFIVLWFFFVVNLNSRRPLSPMCMWSCRGCSKIIIVNIFKVQVNLFRWCTPLLTSFMTYHQVYNKSSTKGATWSWTCLTLWSAWVHPQFVLGFMLLYLQFFVMCFISFFVFVLFS